MQKIYVYKKWINPETSLVTGRKLSYLTNYKSKKNKNPFSKSIFIKKISYPSPMQTLGPSCLNCVEIQTNFVQHLLPRLHAKIQQTKMAVTKNLLSLQSRASV